jgi:gamma-glutamylcyclotransferase (GGCT)/AIG2-like uncharacterized protein YtfP
MPTPTYLFVYGTLMSGFSNPFAELLQQQSEWVGEGTMCGSLYRISWFPGALYQPQSADRVRGEVYRLRQPDSLLKALDEYEEVLPDEAHSLYLRREVPVCLRSGRTLTCWTYLYNQPVEGLEWVPGGNFKNLSP